MLESNNLPDWIAALCAVSSLTLILIGKILWGLRCYDKRIYQVEQKVEHCDEMQTAAVNEVKEDLKHEQRRRDQIWEKLDSMEAIMSQTAADTAFLKGVEEGRQKSNSS